VENIFFMINNYKSVSCNNQKI